MIICKTMVCVCVCVCHYLQIATDRPHSFTISFKTRQTIDKLQNIVSADGRFRNLRDALHRCDPPFIPYLGMYLTDLSFIEEGTPDFTEDGLLNFSKMRMVTQHLISTRACMHNVYFNNTIDEKAVIKLKCTKNAL